MTGYADQRERAHGLDAHHPRRDHQAVSRWRCCAAAVDEALAVKAR